VKPTESRDRGGKMMRAFSQNKALNFPLLFFLVVFIFNHKNLCIMNNNQNQFNIAIDEKVCYNCKHRIWAVAIGQGVRCGKDKFNGYPKLIPSLRKTCAAFEVRDEIKRELYLKNPNQFLFYNLSDRIQFYFSPKEKTIEQILKELTNLQNNREARIEKTKKIIKSQRDNPKLTEIQEQDLVDSKNLKIIIGEVRELKEWLEK
jgi:hypothetical protein